MAETVFEHDGQLRTLLSVDDMVDSIMKRLEANGELDNTLIIYSSDNGYHWGEFGVRGKGLPFSESVRVPYVVRWPGHVDGRRHRRSARRQRRPAARRSSTPPTSRRRRSATPSTGTRSSAASPARSRSPSSTRRYHGYPSWASIRTHELVLRRVLRLGRAHDHLPGVLRPGRRPLSADQRAEGRPGHRTTPTSPRSPPAWPATAPAPARPAPTPAPDHRRKLEPEVGIEPTACALREHCSTTELLGRAPRD